jgi:phosphatidylglycerol:prolipoprotein diacylglycerol transferase
MFPIIHLGPLAIPARPIILLIAFWIASEAAERTARRLNLSAEVAYNLGFLGGLAGLLGARLGYVLENWSVYQTDLGAVFALNLNTLSPLAGLATAIVVAYAYAQRKGIADRRLLDALAPGFVVLGAGLALADLASGDG